MVNRRGPKRASSGGAKAQPHVKNGEAEQQRRRRKKINNRMNKKYTGDIEFVPKDTDNSVPVIDAMAGFSESDDDFGKSSLFSSVHPLPHFQISAVCFYSCDFSWFVYMRQLTLFRRSRR